MSVSHVTDKVSAFVELDSIMMAMTAEFLGSKICRN